MEKHINRDIRIKFLMELASLDSAPAEFHANEYLSKLHNDLGTIRRALLELISSEFIRISNESTDAAIAIINEDLDTDSKKAKTDEQKEHRKNPERFNSSVGGYNKVRKLRIYITLKGLQFLLDWENARWRLRGSKSKE